MTDDFYTSTAVIDRGYRLVFAEDAIAYEPPAASSRDEYRRKVRIMSRGFRGVLARRALLDPRRTGFYAAQLAWHKLLRRLMAVPLLVLAVTSLSLIRAGRWYALAAVAQLAAYGAAALGTFAPRSALGRHKVGRPGRVLRDGQYRRARCGPGRAPRAAHRSLGPAARRRRHGRRSGGRPGARAR